MKRIVDLFAGCGGLSLGFENAGFDIVGAFEYWDVAADCYRRNFNHPVYQNDLSDIDAAVEIISKLSPDIIIGGPPCQDFSHAGKRIEDKRAGLTEAFAQIVTKMKPQWFVMENVDRAQKSAAYATARSIFKNANYGLTEVILNSSFCGVPQKRKRFFCIGSLRQPDEYLLNHINNSLGTKATTIRDYFGSTLDFEHYYRHPRNYCRRAVFSIDEPAPTVRGVNRPVPLGYPGHPNDSKPLDGTIRAMTTLERALVQTFPADYKWIGNKTDMEQMIGNAVPVKLAEFVANALQYHINHSKQETVDFTEFYMWLQSANPLSERAMRDTVSRLKRVDSIHKLPENPKPYYVFQLEQLDEYQSLKPTVRSQLKRAISLYTTFCNANHQYA